MIGVLLQPWENPPMGIPIPDWLGIGLIALISGLIVVWMIRRWRR